MPAREEWTGYQSSQTLKKTIIRLGDINRIPPDVGIFDAPTRCYTINQEWASIVMGMVSLLATVEAWPLADDESYPAIKQILLFLQGGDCMDCTDVLGCVNSDSNYLALQGAIFSQSQTTTQTHMQELNDQYDTTPQSIGANIPTIAPDSDEQDALCYAIGAYLELYAATKTGQIQSQNVLQLSWNRIRQAIHGAFNVFLDVLAPVYTPNLYDCFVSDSDALTALADTAALEQVQCCLLDSLRSIAMSESNFNDAITDCATSLTGTAGNIACLLSNDNDLDVYLMFLEVYNSVLQRQIDGEIFDSCPCVFDWCNLFDFRAGQQSFDFTVPSRPDGLWSSGNGFAPEYGNNGGATGFGNQCYIRHVFASSFTLDSSVIRMTGTNGISGRNMFLSGYLSNSLVYTHNYGAWSTDGTEHEYSDSGTHTIDEFRLGVTAGLGSYDADAFYLHELQINGSDGNNPELGEAC